MLYVCSMMRDTFTNGSKSTTVQETSLTLSTQLRLILAHYHSSSSPPTLSVYRGSLQTSYNITRSAASPLPQPLSLSHSHPRSSSWPQIRLRSTGDSSHSRAGLDIDRETIRTYRSQHRAGLDNSKGPCSLRLLIHDLLPQPPIARQRWTGLLPT